MRTFTTPVVLAVLGLAAIARGAETPVVRPDKDTLVYVGTYTDKRSKGIYAFRLETQNDEVSQNILLVPLGVAAETPNPSFLHVDARRRLVFAVNEIDEFEGRPGGAVSAFAIEPATGWLRLLNQRPSGGTGPCHLVLDPSGRNLLVANYGSGSVSVVRVGADGRLGDTTASIQHHGHSVNPQRQQGPHAHGVTLDPANKFAFVCDLGLDQVLAYRFDADRGTLTPAEPAAIAIKPGSGPRHLVFRPDGRFAYVISEMSSTVTTFAYDASTGRLREIETVSTLPPYFDGANSGAEIALVPSGKFLFVSNRGQNSVVLFAVDREKGTLEYIEDQGTGGKKPRQFAIQPSARHLVVVNQDSDTVLACRIDPDNGRLKPSGIFADVPSPACAVFLPPAAQR